MHHVSMDEWGLPLVVAAKHVIPLWAAGTAAFLAVVLAHSPLSPLPVPPLPHAPVGRFPPRQTVLKVPAPVHVVTVHQTGAHRRWRRRRDAGPGGSTSLAHGDSLQKLVGWLRGELTGVPDRRPLVPPNLRPVAQLAIDTLVRVQPVQVLRAALAVSAAYRDTTPDLTFVRNAGTTATTSKNTSTDLRSDHMIVEIHVQTPDKAQGSKRNFKWADLEDFRNKRDQQKSSGDTITDIEAWTRSLIAGAKASTKTVETEFETDKMDSCLAHLIEAKNSVLARWKGQRLNRRLRKKIAEINRNIE
ncbi:hypothetical protein V5799_003711 [Amblyomma americanum]|uniref:Uncharacterized protein n=1 Tax=Amblyomma americanum TaxID=6943 RepID=A0AAQ4D867_AMBAM